MGSSSRTVDDDELLARLTAAYPVDQCEPDASALAHLSLAVAHLRQTASPSVPLAQRAGAAWRARVPRRMSPVIIAGSLFGVVVTGTGISYAVGVPVPAAVRSVARAVGLAKPPAASTPSTVPAAIPHTTPTIAVNPAVSATRQAESTLSRALDGRHVASGVISRDSAVLAHRLARVQGHRTVGASAATATGQHLLAQACQQLTGSTSSTPSATRAAAATSSSTGASCTAAHGFVRTSEPAPGSGTPPSPSRRAATTGTSEVPPSTLPALPRGTGTGAGTGTGTSRKSFTPSATTPGLSSGASHVHSLVPPAEAPPTTMTRQSGHVR